MTSKESKEEIDFQWLCFSTGMIVSCEDIEKAKKVVKKIMAWANYEIDERALERFDQEMIPTYQPQSKPTRP